MSQAQGERQQIVAAPPLANTPRNYGVIPRARQPRENPQPLGNRRKLAAQFVRSSFLFFVVAVTVAVATASANPADKLKVSIYYASHCPDSRIFIIAQLHPHFCKVQQYVNLNLVPFGKAYSTNQGFSCQNGPEECRGNIIHNCVLKRIRYQKAKLDYVNCAMYDPNQPGHIEEMCVRESDVSVQQVRKCFTSEEGSELMIMAENETKNITHGPLFVPTIVFDDKYDDYDQKNAFKDFEATLCEKLANRNHTNLCSNGVIKSTKAC